MQIIDKTLRKLGRHSLVFATAAADDDELLRSIEDSAASNSLTLEETPDYAQLAGFWEKVEQDLKSDPKWFDFA
ncbi:MAG: hypothetical protein EOT04_00295 [Candidatus Chaera renei]|uniref:Uncharacterized protein n=1 Tax=Candidatus Chaera renei TaxID=2506947 RepID=A0A4Q0AK36_9BACT|nr:MAG: hypothetical protein EOT04_00295 [Candidatus Chaera renei]